MFTSVDKAIAALILAILSLLNIFGVTDVSPETATNINTGLAVLSPVLVWLIPNKKKQ